MKTLKCTVTVILVLLSVTLSVKCYGYNRYRPTWDSLDSRPLPKWYDDAKIGIFIHWGVFSVPAFTEWFWWYWKGTGDPNIIQYMNQHYPPGFDYADFAPQFKAEAYDPQHWASIFNASGAKYVVLTSKHHEGFTLWRSNTSWNWNAVDAGPHRDLIEPLAYEVRNQGLKFGLYHSLFEWFNPIFLADRENNYSTQNFPDKKALPELYDIVNRYKPEIIWSDGDWDASDDYWRSKDFIAWLYNESPVRDTVVVNDRWGRGTGCNHGDFINCQDRYRPGKLQFKKWENAMTLDKRSWGYNRWSTLDDYKSTKELLTEVIETVAYGGNILINVGPTADGRILPIFEERLRSLGDWLAINGQAIYSTRPWRVNQTDRTADVYYTKSQEVGTLYAIFTEFPENGEFTLYSLNDTLVTRDTKAELLITQGSVPVSIQSRRDSIRAFISNVPLSELKNQAWVVKFTSIQCVRRYWQC